MVWSILGAGLAIFEAVDEEPHRMRLPVLKIEDVTERQLCVGCGVCAALEPDRFEIDESLEFGRRPFVKDGAVATTGAGLAACPGIGLSHEGTSRAGVDEGMFAAWGPVLEVWEGWSADESIRSAGSSGGAASALALHCIEAGGMERVLHTAAREDVPYLNESVFSTSRAEVLARTGSRYAPASPCDRIGEVVDLPGSTVFIGKPCDAAAVSAARKARPDIDDKLGCVIAFFCAGAPSTKGTLAILKDAGIEDPTSLRKLRYRGHGWPGMWRAEYEDAEGREHVVERTYAASWGFVQRYRQWRCYICPDHSGEFADLAVGDPWYREVQPGEKGSSLIVVRTERGRRILQAAVASGHIVLKNQDLTLLPRSQPNLLNTRGGLWARLLVLRVFGVVTPVYDGLPTFRFWLKDLGLKAKITSFTGTIKRVFRKKLRERHPMKRWSPPTD